MKSCIAIITLSLIPVVSTTALGGIISIEDRRSAYITTSVSQEDVFEIQYSNPNQTLDEQIERTNIDPLAGSAISSLNYQSSLSLSQFSSSASISSAATTFGTGLNSWSNAGFRNSVVFTLDSTTTFSIAGSISGSSQTGGTYLFMNQLDEHGEIVDQAFNRSVLNNSLDIDSTLTLSAGTYSFLAYSWSYAGILDYNSSDSAAAAHDITVTVIPAPASTALFLLGGTAMMARRRRG